MFFDGISVEPAHEGWGVVAVAVVAEAGFGVLVFGGESVREGVGEGAGGGEDAAEGVVGVGGDGGAVGVEVAHDVAVVVVAGEIRLKRGRLKRGKGLGRGGVFGHEHG